MYARTMTAETTIETHRGQPSRAWITIDSAKRLTPGGEELGDGEADPVDQVAGRLNRRRMNSGTLCTREE